MPIMILDQPKGSQIREMVPEEIFGPARKHIFHQTQYLVLLTENNIFIVLGKSLDNH
jgi:hypothetical protein